MDDSAELVGDDGGGWSVLVEVDVVVWDGGGGGGGDVVVEGKGRTDDVVDSLISASFSCRSSWHGNQASLFTRGPTCVVVCTAPDPEY